MNKKQFIRILHKYERGKSSEEESKFIETYYDLLLAKSRLESVRDDREREVLKKEIQTAVWTGIREREQGKGRIINLLPKMGAAAAMLAILLGTTALFFIVKRRQIQSGRTIAASEQQKEAVIRPGGNKAVLTLANGKKVILDSILNGSLTHQGNVNIIKLKAGKLVYKTALWADSRQFPIVYNTLTTPRGGQYEVGLPDGSKVWLNAASSLHYPVAFSGETRTVELKGEGYFEIAPNAQKPFIVKVGGGQIEVLGTRFNVNSYKSEDGIKTTLKNGSVRVTLGGKSVLLKPGEAANFNKRTGNMKTGVANVAAAIAWKNGLFYFHNTNIKEIMQEAARWYNVNVVYATSDINDKTFSGVLPRYSNIDALLKLLEMTGTVHFKIDDRTITVMN